MSGGHWDYVGSRLQMILEEIGADVTVKHRFPRLAALLCDLGPVFYRIEYELDWDLSGDTAIGDDAQFENQAIWNILELALVAAPDTLFPRGKWATIQALQLRAYVFRTPTP